MTDTSTVIEGTVKFRDGKKWKSRWCVMRKLSPVADCLHLQLYRDSKDRYKQGQTKASLSLQHFLGLQSGFTLDKESNTIAIICQDVTVVLAFDTRERLIQWQVKIANNLGEDEQFLVQIQTAPNRGKITPGPARLHIQDHRFCMTVGVPPRLVGFWLIRQLRRYGVVESRFCFEGGSRCGRGEGLYVLVSDQGEDIARTFQLAADGKLSSRRRSSTRNSIVDSPRRTLHSRTETRMSDVSCMESLLQGSGPDTCCGCGCSETVWPSSETRPDSCDYGDTNSVADYQDNHLHESCRAGDNGMGRCTSCISKLGALSRSSTLTNTPSSVNGSGFTPAWTMDTDGLGGCGRDSNVNCFNTAQSTCGALSRLSTSDCWSSSGSSSSTVAERCSCCPPLRPPKPSQLNSQSVTNSPIKKKHKPPMPLPFCNCPHHQNLPNPYDNYDIPKILPTPITKQEEVQRPETPRRMSAYPTSDDYYDTPKNIKENLIGEYGNYDTPPPPTMALKNVTACLHHNFSSLRPDKEEVPAQGHVCPCHRVTCWAESWAQKPQHLREISSPVLQRVRRSSEGISSSGKSTAMPIYATVDKSKKTKFKVSYEQHNEDTKCVAKENEKNKNEALYNIDTNNCNYANIEVVDPKDLSESFPQESNSHNSESLNYANLDFAHSLEHYENSKELLLKAGITQEEIEKMLKDDSQPKVQGVDKHSSKLCTKCGHSCSSGTISSRPLSVKQDDYLIMEPTSNQDSSQQLSNKPKSVGGKLFPGYLPMHPVPNLGGFNKQDLLKLRLQREMGVDKSSSTPSLIASFSEACRRRLESDIQRVPGSAMLGINHSVSAANSPYLRRRVMGCMNDSVGSSETLCNSLSRKRSSSADSTKYIDDLEAITERTLSISSPTQIQNTLNSNTTSVDSLNNHSQKSSSHDNYEESTVIERQNHTLPDAEKTSGYHMLNGNKPPIMNSFKDVPPSQGINNQTDASSVNVRRSSSVPCKTGHNRDSSSSNDSGVSIGSLKHRGGDFAEFELPLTTSMSSRRHFNAFQKNLSLHYADCYHSSLPRRSKSVDPLRELTFQFQQIEIPLKSSSAEAEIPICLGKRDSKGCTSPGSTMPYIDSRSTSSGTSDMSDYIETLSMSSYSSSDTPDCLQLGRSAATTLRPRSGREYHKIDRYILESDEQNSSYTSISSAAEKSESPSPGYVSSSPGQ